MFAWTATDGATTFSATCDEQLTEQDTVGLKAGKIAIYFDAQILYRNVFDLDHRTGRFVGGKAGLKGQKWLIRIWRMKAKRRIRIPRNNHFIAHFVARREHQNYKLLK